MDIKTVAENLRRTIAGKELLYEARPGIREYLEINLTELKTILADIEACIPLNDKP